MVRDSDEKLLVEQTKAEAAEKEARHKAQDVAAEAGIAEVLQSTHEIIRELSQAKVGLQEQNLAKEEETSAKAAELLTQAAEIDRLKRALAALPIGKAEHEEWKIWVVSSIGIVAKDCC